MSEPWANTDKTTQALITAERLRGRRQDHGAMGLKPGGVRDRLSDARLDSHAPVTVAYETNEQRTFGGIVETLATITQIAPVGEARDAPPVEQTKSPPGWKALLRAADDKGLGVPPGAAAVGPAI